jgi:hypothetical protein
MTVIATRLQKLKDWLDENASNLEEQNLATLRQEYEDMKTKNGL